jgi:Tfp pilus assembly protein PilN
MEININLIPGYKKEEIARSRHLKLIIKSEIWVFLLLVILAYFIFGLNKVVDMNVEMLATSQKLENEGEKYQEIKKYEEGFKEINGDISEILKIKKDQLYWSVMLDRLSSGTNAGIEINSLANKDYSVYLAGRANNRDDLISFKDTLSRDDCFEEVDLPLSNLVTQENIDFQMDLKIKEACLKK